MKKQREIVVAVFWGLMLVASTHMGVAEEAIGSGTASWSGKDMSARFKTVIEGGIGSQSTLTPEAGSQLLEIVGTFGRNDPTALTLEGTNVFIEMAKEEMGIRKRGKWDLLAVGVVANDGNGEYMFLKELVQGAVTKSLTTGDGCRVAKKDATSPLTLTLTKNPSRLCLAFPFTEELSGRQLRLHFGDAIIPISLAPQQAKSVANVKDSALLPPFQNELRGTNPIRIRKEAKVVVEFPDNLQSSFSYHNISAPVWIFNIRFREVNGVAATMTSKKMKIKCRDGAIYGDLSDTAIFDSEAGENVKVNVPANGTGSYTSWVNSPDHKFSGGTMYLDYTGVDAHGKSITASVSFKLEEYVLNERAGDDAPKVPVASHVANTVATSRSHRTSLIYTSAYWEVECESVQFASVVKGPANDMEVTLRAHHPAPILAVVFLCQATANPPEKLNEVLEVPAVRLSEGGGLHYAGYQTEFLTRPLPVTPTWMVVEPKKGPRTIHLGPPLSGGVKLDMHQGDRMRLTVVYNLPDPVVIPPDGAVEIRTSLGSISLPFPPANAEPAPNKPDQQTQAAPSSPTDRFGQVHIGDTKARVLETLGRKGFIAMGETEILVYPEGQITLEHGLVTVTDRTQPSVEEPLAPNRPGLSGNVGRSRPHAVKPPTMAPTRPPSDQGSEFFKTARFTLPSYGDEGVFGSNEVCVQNPNGFAVAVALQNHNGGSRKFEVPASGTATTSVKAGDYDIYFVYQNDPTSVYQGDGFKLQDNHRIDIKLVTVTDGNYGIRKIR